MDTLTPIVQAISAGAASAFQNTTSQAVKDAYDGIKSLIKRKFGQQVSVETIEKDPSSTARRQILTEELQQVGAENDHELIEELQKFLGVLKSAKLDATAVGVNVEEVEAEFLKISKVKTAGIGVNVGKSKFSGGITIGEVKTENTSNP